MDQAIQKNKETAMLEDSSYKIARQKLYNAVLNNKGLHSVEWDGNGRCHIVQVGHPENRGAMATIQPKANGKGLVVFFAIAMHLPDHAKPFIRNINIKLTVNETPSGVRLLWFVKNKPVWNEISSYTYIFSKFHFTGNIIYTVLNEIEKVYSREAVLPILKYMDYNHELRTMPLLYGIDQGWMKKLSGTANPRQILNNAYGKHGQEGLSKNAFGGISKITNLNTFAYMIELTRMLKPLPSAFFDKIIIDNDFASSVFRIQRITLPTEEINNIRYFLKYFNHTKIQNELLADMNENLTRKLDITDFSTLGTMHYGLWGEIIDSARMLKAITNRELRNNILRFKGTITETHDLITLEFNKIKQEDKKIKYNSKCAELDNKMVTDNIISVLPKTTHELVLWGSTQHNCIGSYGDTVAQRSNNETIVGFKDITTGNWIGHARISKGYDKFVISELRGDYNSNLDDKDNAVISAFLKEIINKW